MEITYIEEKDFYRIVKVGKALSKGTSPDWRAWRLAYILRRTGEKEKIWHIKGFHASLREALFATILIRSISKSKQIDG